MWNLRCVSRSVAILGSLALLLLSIPAVFGQSDNGSIVGFAKDPSGAIVPKAKVTLRNESTGVVQRDTSNDAGYYIFNSIPSGLYTVSVEAAGFKRFDSVHNKLDANSTLELDAHPRGWRGHGDRRSGRLGASVADRVGRRREDWSPASRSTRWS